SSSFCLPRPASVAVSLPPRIRPFRVTPPHPPRNPPMTSPPPRGDRRDHGIATSLRIRPSRGKSERRRPRGGKKGSSGFRVGKNPMVEAIRVQGLGVVPESLAVSVTFRATWHFSSELFGTLHALAGTTDQVNSRGSKGLQAPFSGCGCNL